MVPYLLVSKGRAKTQASDPESHSRIKKPIDVRL